MDLTRFDRAEKFFGELEQKANSAVLTQDANEHFNTAAYAAAVLYSLGEERLLDLERQKVVHASTVSGSSLSSAIVTINNYFVGGMTQFESDYYEQLHRTCRSAKKFLENCQGSYLSAF